MKKTFRKTQTHLARALKVIPLGSQIFSKSYMQYVKGAAPLYATRAEGAYIWDIDGNRYVDFINGLLPVILGYQYPAVDAAIRRQLNKGIIFSLSSVLEYELAQLLIKHVPCAEMVRFGKNGSDVTTGAVRLARAVTGREHVAICGYHGWHDWYIAITTRDKGIPRSVKKLSHSFVYNDVSSLKAIFRKYPKKIAAVIMEPMNYVEPKNNFLQKVKQLAHKHGALLIFDEVITGFRYHMGGAQKLFGVTPDLSAFGKSMGNGMPIAALVGKRKFMWHIPDIFYSFTFSGEALSLAAAIATVNVLEKKRVIEYLWRLGAKLQDGANGLVEKHSLERVLHVAGKPCWQIMHITASNGFTEYEIKSFIQQELLQAGFLWYGQHNMSFSHTVAHVNGLISAYDGIFARLRTYLQDGSLRKQLAGKPIDQIFKVR